jgi:hypothetical protein
MSANLTTHGRMRAAARKMLWPRVLLLVAVTALSLLGTWVFMQPRRAGDDGDAKAARGGDQTEPFSEKQTHHRARRHDEETAAAPSPAEAPSALYWVTAAEQLGASDDDATAAPSSPFSAAPPSPACGRVAAALRPAAAPPPDPQALANMRAERAWEELRLACLAYDSSGPRKGRHKK